MPGSPLLKGQSELSKQERVQIEFVLRRPN